jgi:fatty-acyl-CoA synthase
MMTGGGVSFWTWDDIFREATRRARALRSRGVERGSIVAGVMNNGFDAVVGLFAVWFAGASFASLPERSRGMSRTGYWAQLARIAAQSGTDLLLADGLDGSRSEGAGGVGLRVQSWASLDLAGKGCDEFTLPPPDAAVVVQYSSGSTGPPKGCMLRGRAIAEQQEILAEVTQVNRGADVECSWVPLSHDMGMFGGLVFACYNDIDLALSTPERFMLSPRTWFGDLSATGASITPGTNSALALAARAQRKALPEPLRLRSGIIGAEIVDWHVLEAAAQAFGPSGLGLAGLRPAYGMAEVTLAATCTPYGRPPRRLVLDREALEHEVIVVLPDDVPPDRGVSITSNGVACLRTEVTSDRGAGIGELRIRSPSLADGYLGLPETSTSALRDGVFHSNDLGFIHEGEVYILGRTDDVLIDAGRSVHLTEVEATIEDVIDARRGSVVLVDVRDGPAPKLVAVIELRRSPKDPDALASAVHRAVMEKCGIPVVASLFVAKGQLPMTPSGKKQRRRCQQLLQRRGFDVVAVAGSDAMQLL